jgi:hypothetical protein
MAKAISISLFRALGAALFVLIGLSAVMPQAHASSMSDYLENKLVDALFRGQAYTMPTTIYFALATSTGTDAACGTEVTGGNYSRASVTGSLANWAGTQGAGTTAASSGTSGTTSNNNIVAWPTPSATWGLVVEICAMDASTGGNLLFRNPITISKTINNADVVDLPAGALTFQFDN